MAIDGKTLQGLVNAQIVELRGVSGCAATVDMARQAPYLVEMHAMSGRRYVVVGYRVNSDEILMEEL